MYIFSLNATGVKKLEDHRMHRLPNFDAGRERGANFVPITGDAERALPDARRKISRRT